MLGTLDQSLLSKAAAVPVQPLDWPALNKRDIQVSLRRDDLIDSQLSGNKFYKLHHNLLEAKATGHHTLLSFGGVWSNHLHALAAAGKLYGFNTVGVVRGEDCDNAMLRDARNCGMQLKFWTREQFRQGKKLEQNQDLFDSLLEDYGRFYVIPEGGSNLLGAKGCAAISMATELALDGNFTDICLACGTGASLAGVAAGLGEDKKAWGISVLKGQGKMADEVGQWVRALCGQERNNWQLQTGYHGGGYARLKPDLLHYMQAFEARTGVLLDPVYTAKLCRGVEAMAEAGVWPEGSRLVLVHSGGLQGRRGFESLASHSHRLAPKTDNNKG